MYTFGQLKTAIRGVIWPDGEADNLVVAHNKFFVDALLDLQTWVKCLQQDHIDIIPQCATLYNCGLTALDAPRGTIFKVSVIDKLDPDTGLESADADTDYCSEIVYRQIDPCHIRSYLTRSQRQGCCLSIPFYFGLPISGCGSAAYPIPTNADLPDGLPLLPLGYSYPQASTDRTSGRSLHGVWAIERGKLYIAPWIQSTETILIKWDGIKRTWTDADGVDPDPQFAQAVEEYVRWQHAGKYDRDEAEHNRAAAAYNLARQTLIYNCRQETMLRSCKPSLARATSLGTSTLYYNEEQQSVATCEEGYTGTAVTVTIPAGTVGSTISVADANQKAQQQAQVQAQAQLVCTEIPVTYWNVAQTQTAACDAVEGAPAPVGAPVTVTVAANTYSSTISQADADNQARAAALAEARAQRTCTYGNAEQTAICPNDDSITATIAANTYQSTLSQSDADRQALTAATNLVNADAGCLAAGGGLTFYNEAKLCSASTFALCSNPLGGYTPGTVLVTVIVPAGVFSSTTSQSSVNQYAELVGTAFAQDVAAARSAKHQCGSYNTTYPNP